MAQQFKSPPGNYLALFSNFDCLQQAFERLRALQAWFGQGHEYAYLYPGLQKVAQAAGRVNRSEADRGAARRPLHPPRGAPTFADLVGLDGPTMGL